MRLGGIDYVITAIDPVADKLLDQISRMLTIAVHEQDGPATGMVQSRHQSGFLAEIARQRNHLNVERIGRKPARDGEGGIGAAVIDIDDLAVKPVILSQGLCQPAQTFMQERKPGRLVVQRNDNGQPLRRGCGGGGCQAGDVGTQGHRSAFKRQQYIWQLPSIVATRSCRPPASVPQESL